MTLSGVVGASVTYTSLPPAPPYPTPATQFPKGKGPGGLSRRARPRPAPRRRRGSEGRDSQAPAHVCTPHGIWSRGRDASRSPHTPKGRRGLAGSQRGCQPAKPKPLWAAGGAGPPVPPRPTPAPPGAQRLARFLCRTLTAGGSWARTRAGLAQWLEKADPLSSVSCASRAARGRRGKTPRRREVKVGPRSASRSESHAGPAVCGAGLWLWHRREGVTAAPTGVRRWPSPERPSAGRADDGDGRGEITRVLS